LILGAAWRIPNSGASESIRRKVRREVLVGVAARQLHGIGRRRGDAIDPEARDGLLLELIVWPVEQPRSSPGRLGKAHKSI
jgi:hypothetical protein